MNRDIKTDRMWTEAKEHLAQIVEIADKIAKGVRLSDGDMLITKYGLLLVSAELQRRRCDDLEENVRIHEFGD